MKRGPLIVLSGPSGVGKSTVVKGLLSESGLPLRLSVSATTRPRRAGEADGVDYYFWDRERFLHEVQAGAFLEYAEVHGLNLYGTLEGEVARHQAAGFGVILDVDVQGYDQVRAKVPIDLAVFLLAPSMDEYERRLRSRGSEDEAAIQRRLGTARRELGRANDYPHRVINDDLATTVATLRDLIATAF